jgi:gas vesicle protein
VRQIASVGKLARSSEEKVMIRRRNAWPQIFSAFAIGLGAGAALGALFAPQSGEDTREFLRGTAQDGVDEAMGRGKTVVRRVRKNLAEAKEFVNDIADTAEDAFRDARSALS